jgi:hypothetical protein
VEKNMIGKKMFFLKAFLRSEKVRDQISFDDFLGTYTKEKLTAFSNSDIHNDRTDEKNLSGILFKVSWSKDDAFFVREANEKMLESIRYEIREHDVLLKWEEDEFLILLPECSLESAQKISHLIKSIVESKSFVNMKATLEYAITMHENDDTPDSFTERIENALRSKEAA